MEISLPKAAMVLVVLGLVGGGGAYAWAQIEMQDRVHDLHGAVGRIGHARGGRPPSDADVRAQIEALAAERRVELADLTVTSREEAGAGAVVDHVGGPLAAALSGRQRVYEIRATAHSRALAFSLTEPFEARLALRTSLELAPSIAAPPGRSVDDALRRDLE